jgi:hypothetical protein
MDYINVFYWIVIPVFMSKGKITVREATASKSMIKQGNIITTLSLQPDDIIMLIERKYTIIHKQFEL